ncbi:MAG: hypothetical protein PVS3B1_18760 [Ktedonobacteraceae bacterium]
MMHTIGQRLQGWTWLVFGLGIAVIAGAAVLLGTLVGKGGGIPGSTSGAFSTLNTYCNALKSQDYGTAYKQLDNNTHTAFTIVDFTLYSEDNAGAGKVQNCSVKSVNSGTTQATGIVDYVYNTNKTQSSNYMLHYEQNTWRIANVSISTPSSTLHAYCEALKKQDYPAAYDLVSGSIRSKDTLAQFTQRTDRFVQDGGGIASCQATNVSDTGADAQGTIVYTSNRGKTATLDYTMVLENGAWKMVSQQIHA